MSSGSSDEVRAATTYPIFGEVHAQVLALPKSNRSSKSLRTFTAAMPDCTATMTPTAIARIVRPRRGPSRIHPPPADPTEVICSFGRAGTLPTVTRHQSLPADGPATDDE